MVHFESMRLESQPLALVRYHVKLIIATLFACHIHNDTTAQVDASRGGKTGLKYYAGTMIFINTRAV